MSVMATKEGVRPGAVGDEQLRATVEDRWTTLGLDVSGSEASEASSELYDQLNGAIRTYAGRIVHGVCADELRELGELEYQIESEIKERIVSWGVRILAAREVKEAVPS
jgi:hypothetical protein